jgi:hypothetical protein
MQPSGSISRCRLERAPADLVAGLGLVRRVVAPTRLLPDRCLDADCTLHHNGVEGSEHKRQAFRRGLRLRVAATTASAAMEIAGGTYAAPAGVDAAVVPQRPSAVRDTPSDRSPRESFSRNELTITTVASDGAASRRRTIASARRRHCQCRSRWTQMRSSAPQPPRPPQADSRE